VVEQLVRSRHVLSLRAKVAVPAVNVASGLWLLYAEHYTAGQTGSYQLGLMGLHNAGFCLQPPLTLILNTQLPSTSITEPQLWYSDFVPVFATEPS